MKYQLAIDRGNSFTKLSVFDGKEIVKVSAFKDDELAEGLSETQSTFNIQNTIFSDVRDGYSNDRILSMLPKPCVLVSTKLILPFALQYSTPETIGHDRLANMAGATALRPGQQVLVIDFGTCTTYSLLCDGAFCGGSISPGRRMRFRSVHDYTGRLPLLEAGSIKPALLGDSTAGSIQSGIEFAILLETDSMIEAYCRQFSNPTVMITGGDYSFFENNLKSATFAEPQLTQIGLHEILRNNIR
jgi:type III pantothenate kinase